MRIISMVPSWTETLLLAGVEVVGRTRFCIHPQDRVPNIPVVGGTKDIDWDLVYSLQADLIIFDREENLLEMSEECLIPQLVTHVKDLPSLQSEFEKLGDTFQNAQLIEWAVELFDLLQQPSLQWDWQRIPAAQKVWGKPQGDLIYVIWKKPWMAVSPETFIGSMLEKLGAKLLKFEDSSKYPVFEIEDYPKAFYLFSSEPFPFHKKEKELLDLKISGALVDGECFSWYGIRALNFLKSEFARRNSLGKLVNPVQT